MAEIKGGTSSSDAGEARLLFLAGTVTEELCKTLIEEILKINYQDDEREKKEKDFVRKPINLYVISYGGYAYDGFGLIGVIERSKTPVYTYVDGKAMSMGLAIAAAGHKRFASKHASFMYHQIASGTWGKLEQLKEDVNETERLGKMYDGYILSRSKIREADINPVKERRGEWYFGAEEALKLGIIDEII